MYDNLKLLYLDRRMIYTNYDFSCKISQTEKRAIFTIKTQLIHHSKITVRKKIITNKQQIWDLFLNTMRFSIQ